MSYPYPFRYTKISNVSFPPGCPQDFTVQVRALVNKHNQLIEDLLTLQATVRELQTTNAESQKQLENSQQELSALQEKHDQLQTISEKLAVRYEALTSRRSPVAPKAKAPAQRRPARLLPALSPPGRPSGPSPSSRGTDHSTAPAGSASPVSSPPVTVSAEPENAKKVIGQDGSDDEVLEVETSSP